MRTEKGITDLVAGIIISSKDKQPHEIAKDIIKTLVEEGNLSIIPIQK